MRIEIPWIKYPENKPEKGFCYVLIKWYEDEDEEESEPLFNIKESEYFKSGFVDDNYEHDEDNNPIHLANVIAYVPYMDFVGACLKMEGQDA